MTDMENILDKDFNTNAPFDPPYSEKSTKNLEPAHPLELHPPSMKSGCSEQDEEQQSTRNI